MSRAGPRVAVAVLGKDLLLDLRSRDRIGHMAVFAALIVVLLGLTLPTSRAARADWIPALLWIVFLFTSLLGLSRSFQAETEQGAVALLMQYLSTVPDAVEQYAEERVDQAVRKAVKSEVQEATSNR